jgi:hypothetical protein
MLADRRTDRVARSGHDVEDAVGDPGLRPQLGDPEQAQRGRRSGLDDHAVAGRQRRPELPGRHLGRVVPRYDRADDADRLARDGRDGPLGGGRDLAVQLVDGLGVPADAGGGLRHVQPDRVADRLACIDRLDQVQLAGVRVDEIGPHEQDPLPDARVDPRPDATIRRGPGSRYGRVDIGRVTFGDLGDRLAGRRVLGHEPTPVTCGSEIAADKHVGAQPKIGDLARSLLSVGDQGVGHPVLPRRFRL